MNVDQFVERAISVPFADRGRDWSGWDCWGLIFIAYRELFAIEIPSLIDEYDVDRSFSELNDLVNTQRPLWSTVSRPEFGDVRLFRISRYQTHVALVLPHGLMIHTNRSVGTTVERLDAISWAKRHVDYFRHERDISSRRAASA